VLLKSFYLPKESIHNYKRGVLTLVKDSRKTIDKGEVLCKR